MKSPLRSVTSGLALLPTTETVAPSTGWCERLSVTMPDIVSFLCCALIGVSTTNKRNNRSAVRWFLVICGEAEPGFPRVQRWYQVFDNPSCLRGVEVEEVRLPEYRCGSFRYRPLLPVLPCQ